jgi:hypothetical protein
MFKNWTKTNASNDDAMHSVADTITADISALLAKKSYSTTYLYMNDAGKGQCIFQSYPTTNLRRLKLTCSKHDPLRIYTNLLIGE